MVPIALPTPSNATAICAGKLALRTLARHTLVFIRVVPTVIVVVTLPAARHTAVVLTAELVWLACALITLLLGFIGSVSTVILSVTLPACRDAAS